MKSSVSKNQETRSQDHKLTSGEKTGRQEALFQFVDNRPEAVQMRKMQQMIYKSVTTNYPATANQVTPQQPLLSENKPATTQLKENVNSSKDVIQRQIIVAPDMTNLPVMRELEQSPLYQQINAKAQRVYLMQSDEGSKVVVRKTHNQDEFEDLLPGGMHDQNIDYIVNIKNEQIRDNGTDEKPNRVYRRFKSPFDFVLENARRLHQNALFIHELEHPPGEDPKPVDLLSLTERHLKGESKGHEMHTITPTPAFSSHTDDTLGRHRPRGILTPLPFPSIDHRHHFENHDPFDIRKILGTAPPSYKDTLAALVPKAPILALHNSYQATSNRQSLYTIILHELGHVKQHLATRRIYSGPFVEDITHESKPLMPAGLVAQVTAAYNNQVLSAPIWFELMDVKNTMQKWITPFKDHVTDHLNNAQMAREVNRFEELGETIAKKCQVWVEYDNIITHEHPVSMERSESIRHFHGTEMRLAGAGQGDALETRVTRANNQSIPTSLSDVQSTMVNQAHRLTAGIIREVTDYVQLFSQFP